MEMLFCQVDRVIGTVVAVKKKVVIFNRCGIDAISVRCFVGPIVVFGGFASLAAATVYHTHKIVAADSVSRRNVLGQCFF